MKKLLILALSAGLTLPLLLYAAINEGEARKQALAKFGPLAVWKKDMPVTGTKWTKFRVVIPAPLCADREYLLGEGASFEAALADFDKRHPKGVQTLSGQVNTAYIEVDSRIVTSMRLASDSSYDGAEVFRPITNQVEKWTHEFKQNIGALQPGIHAWCPVFFGSELPHTGRAEPAQVFRVVQ